MNPLPLIGATLWSQRGPLALFALLVAASVALAIGVSAQERALREASARAARPFDLVIGAPGGQMDLMLAVVFARPLAVGLVEGAVLARLAADPRVGFAAPVAFGDSVDGAPVIGTTADLVAHLAGPPRQGRAFAHEGEAVAGALSGFALGDRLTPSHGQGRGVLATPHDGVTLTVVGILAPSGTPWDRALIVPVEQVWATHGLASGHDPAGPRAAALGPPFDPGHTPGLPAIVVRPASLADAYALRQAWRGPASTAFFPGESLAELYGYLGLGAWVLQGFALATQGIVLLAVLTGIAALARAGRRQSGVLRALGAPPLYLALAGWGAPMAVIAAGVGLGLAGGWAAAAAVADLVGTATGMAVQPRLTGTEAALAARTLGLGALLALWPAVAAYRLDIPRALAGD